MKFMVTNGGPHPADKWAEVTRDAILDLIVVDENSASEAAVAARDAKRMLSLTLFNILNRHHDAVQKHERSELRKKDGHKRLCVQYDPTAPAEAALSEVLNALAAVPMFADHFAKPEVRETLFRIVGQHFADAMHIERSYHADRNPHTKEAREFRAMQHG